MVEVPKCDEAGTVDFEVESGFGVGHLPKARTRCRRCFSRLLLKTSNVSY